MIVSLQMVAYGTDGVGDINDDFIIEVVEGKKGDRIRPIVVRVATVDSEFGTSRTV